MAAGNVSFRVTEDHIALLKRLCLCTAVFIAEPDDPESLRPFECVPDVDKKRPFGDSGCCAHSVLDVVGRHPDGNGDYLGSDLAYARILLAQLPVAYEAVMAHGAVEPCVQEIPRHGAWFGYMSRRALEYWRGAVAEFDRADPENAGRLTEFVMNARNKTPMDVPRDLALLGGTGWTALAMACLSREAVRKFRAAHPEHSDQDGAAVASMLMSGEYGLEWPEWA